MTETQSNNAEPILGALEKEDLDKLLEQLKTVVPEVMDNIAGDWIVESARVIAKDIDEGNIATKGNEYDTLLTQLRWHIRRKGKFGASDMSALYMEYKGLWYPFGDAASIVAEKLCIKPVEPMNGDTSRGVFVENHCREAFIKMMRKQDIHLVEDEYAKRQLSALRFSGGIPDLPWMDCSPDDIFLDQDGYRYLIDYKCPAEASTVESMQRDIPEYYQAQLAQEKIMLDYLELPVDRVMLAPFSTKDWKVYPVDCEITDEMCMDVVNAGNYYKTFLEKRELPRRPPSKDYEFVAQLPEELQNVVLEFTLHNKGKLIHEAEADRLKIRMRELMLINNIDVDNRDKKIGVPLIQMRWQNTRRKNTLAMENALKALGVDINEDRFYTESESQVIAVDRGKYNSYSMIRDGIEDFMAGQIANNRTDVVDQFREQFRARDGVTVQKPKPASKAKAKKIQDDPAVTPAPF